MQPKIYLSSPNMGGKEFEFVKEAFDTNWIAPLGPHVNGFEEDLQRYTGTAHAAALSAGTAALHLALILADVQAGDWVLCSTFTFSASANPIVYQGALPVFIESEAETWNASPEFLEQAILDLMQKGKKPKAFILVHLYGMPAKVDEIKSICDKYGVVLIEDAAEALGSRYKDKHPGSIGSYGILSFNGNKIITTSGGGALISNDKEKIEKARFLATQARDPAPHYQHSEIGYNYRMSNICAGIGRGQMLVLDQRVQEKRALYDWYVDFLGNIPGITFLEEPNGFFSNRWLTCILVDPSATAGITREDIRLALEKENIESRPLWKPMHLQPVFKQSPYYGDRLSEEIFDKGLCLPSDTNIGEGEKSRIKSVFKALNLVR
ncbi:MAG: aminotransferase class I/II-fold pyridoxal phosphate-dependent enzyme [Chitinophagaceae bacterium]|nr:aminotransferase class I/II-fold pyridoxal phosphate-dependent enzyme [Chitinophagaceae bacterium]